MKSRMDGLGEFMGKGSLEKYLSIRGGGSEMKILKANGGTKVKM